MSGVRTFTSAKLRVKNPETGNSYSSKTKVKIFLDTGSSHTIIPAESLHSIDSKAGPFETMKANVKTANGNKKMIALKGVELCIDSCCFVGDVLVTDGIPGDVLLGSDFFKATKTSIDFGKGKIKCQGKSQKLNLES